MSKRNKIIESPIQPNPKEAEVWAKPNGDGTRDIKKYDATSNSWVCCGGSESGNNEDNVEYYRIDWDKAEELGYEHGSNNNTTMSMCFSISMTNLVKGTIGGQTIVVTPAYMNYALSFKACDYIEFRPISIFMTGQDETHFKTFNDVTQSVTDVSSCFIPITKEEFYSFE